MLSGQQSHGASPITDVMVVETDLLKGDFCSLEYKLHLFGFYSEWIHLGHQNIVPSIKHKRQTDCLVRCATSWVQKGGKFVFKGDFLPFGPLLYSSIARQINMIPNKWRTEILTSLAVSRKNTSPTFETSGQNAGNKVSKNSGAPSSISTATSPNLEPNRKRLREPSQNNPKLYSVSGLKASAVFEEKVGRTLEYLKSSIEPKNRNETKDKDLQIRKLLDDITTAEVMNVASISFEWDHKRQKDRENAFFV